MAGSAFFVFSATLVLCVLRANAFTSLGSRTYLHRRSLSMMASTATKVESARSSGLALQLDDGTRKSHSVAENTAFVTGFFKGLSNKQSFGQLVCSLYHVYSAMEKALDETPDASVKTMDYSELRRKDTLVTDMKFYFGEDFATKVKPSPATMAYVAHIERVAQKEPYLLIAHQYTRYLGDLFGGQMMGGMATKSLKLEDGQGIAFYRFDDIPNPKDFIEDWYANLNSLDLTEAQKQAIVDEGNEVFRLNIDILEELEGNGVLTAFKFALDSLWTSIKSKFQG